MNLHTELSLINKHFNKRHKEAGSEYLVWYEFIPLGTSASATSIYDDVYDESPSGTGGRKYKPGVVLPALLASETEDQRRAIPEGRLTLETMNLFVPVKAMRNAGIETVWEYRNHLNDIFLYDGRFFSVFDYAVRGRVKGEVFVLIQGQELYVDQEFVNDSNFPELSSNNLPWPASLPKIG